MPRRINYSKYRAIKTEVDGIKFDSKKEAKRYSELKLMERAGNITNLRTQVPYVLIEKSEYGQAIKYLADFVYYDNDKKQEIVEDTKSGPTATPVYRLKKRLMAEKYGIRILEL